MCQQKKKDATKKKGAKPKLEPSQPEVVGMESKPIPRKKSIREARSLLEEKKHEKS